MMGGVLKREKAVRFGWRDPPLTRLPRAPCRRRRIEPDENDIAARMTSLLMVLRGEK